MLHRQVDVGKRLRLYPLSGVDDQQRPLARRQAARHLVAEVDVARGVDEVELVRLALRPRVRHADRLGLDSDSSLALQVHGVQDLLDHIPALDGAGGLKEPIGEGGLTVVDVGDDAEVADKARIHVSSVA